MTTLKYFSQTLLRYFLALAGTAALGVILLITGVSFLILNRNDSNKNPETLFYQNMVKDGNIQLTPSAKAKLQKQHAWIMILSDTGKIEQSYRLPSDINKKTYRLTDIASSTRWYLRDYPVFTFVVGSKTVLLGYPKGSYSKLSNNYYSVDLSLQFFQILLVTLFIMLMLFFIIYLRSKFKLRKEMAPITEALNALSTGDNITVNTKGNLSEIKEAINQTSHLLAKTRTMRDHWIRGISHDLRTPLTLMMGYTDQLENLYGSNRQTQQLQHHIHSMEGIISNLNMVYLLDNREIKRKLVTIELNSLLRQIVADLLNTYDSLDLTFRLLEQPCYIRGDYTLLERAFKNCLLNSITHNDHPKIELTGVQSQNKILITICDDGEITKEKVQELTAKDNNYDFNGMGTIITKQIIKFHQGHVSFDYADPGLKITISLPTNGKNSDN